MLLATLFTVEIHASCMHSHKYIDESLELELIAMTAAHVVYQGAELFLQKATHLL